MPLETSPSDELSPERVYAILKNLGSSGVLGGIRADLQETRTFFDPNEGYVTEGDDTSSAGAVFDMYRDALAEGIEASVRKHLPSTIPELIAALEVDSRKRMALFGYYGIREDTPWREAREKINSIRSQSWKYDSFPTPADQARTFQHIRELEEKKS